MLKEEKSKRKNNYVWIDFFHKNRPVLSIL